MSMSPRPDQRALASSGGQGGSRSGAGELAGALGYPGVPAAVPNCQGASLFQQGAAPGFYQLFKFPNPGRVWAVILSYAIDSLGSFAGTAQTVAQVHTVTSGVTLAVVQLAVAGASQHAEGTCPMGLPGLPVVAGEVVRLNVNNGNGVAALQQQASASVLYSIP